MSPIWMSYYTDGCLQELHCDSFHGPFAFVLSLTHWDSRPFTGGGVWDCVGVARWGAGLVIQQQPPATTACSVRVMATTDMA